MSDEEQSPYAEALKSIIGKKIVDTHALRDGVDNEFVLVLDDGTTVTFSAADYEFTLNIVKREKAK